MSNKKIIRNTKKILVVGDSFSCKDKLHSHWVDLIFSSHGIKVDHFSIRGGNTLAIISQFWDKIADQLSDYQCLFYFPTSLLRHYHLQNNEKVDNVAIDVLNRLEDFYNAPDKMLDFYLYGDESYLRTDHQYANPDVRRSHMGACSMGPQNLDEVAESIYARVPIWYNTQLSMLATRSMFLKVKQHDILTINNIASTWKEESKDIQKHIPEIDISWIIGRASMDITDESLNHYSLKSAAKIKKDFIKHINSLGYSLS